MSIGYRYLARYSPSFAQVWACLLTDVEAATYPQNTTYHTYDLRTEQNTCTCTDLRALLLSTRYTHSGLLCSVPPDVIPTQTSRSYGPMVTDRIISR